MKIFDRVLSLGPSCEAKLNLVRILRAREGRTDGARRVQANPKGAPSSVFDWQVTPESALLEYFRRDFRGMFEREDLIRGPGGWVVNTRFGTHHLHEFGAYDKDGDIIAARYTEARARHDYLCNKFRAMLGDPAPTLFVRSVALNTSAKAELTEYVRKRSGADRFAFMTVPTDPDAGVLQWPANEPLWDAAFAGISVTAKGSETIGLPGLDALSFYAHRVLRHLKKFRF
jgi:hypothetical protein